jgi:coatomer subunit beta'
MGEAEKCIDILLKSKKVAEAAFFARSYAPSKLGKVMKHWEELLKQR